MIVDRMQEVENRFLQDIRDFPFEARSFDWEEPLVEGFSLTCRKAVELFESQLTNRLVDQASRWLRKQNQGFYTIGSSGHEGNVAVAEALRPTDMAFLHYRSGGFFIQRARQVPGETPILDILKGMAACKDEPIAGGRHKVFGSKRLNIPPQTSTIASHLPKALGAAFVMDRRKKLGLPLELPEDSLVVCTFGDASSNHSTAVGAINASSWASYQHLPLPLLWVCEDNGIGISVKTPNNWIQQNYQNRVGIQYFWGDGLDLVDAYEASQRAAEYVRKHRKPAFLHLRTVRLFGHAGSDVESGYRSLQEIEQEEKKDPLGVTARHLLAKGCLSPQAMESLWFELKERVFALAKEVILHPKLSEAKEIMQPLFESTPKEVQQEIQRVVGAEKRRAFWETLPEEESPKHLANSINRCLGDLMLKYPESMLFGEDVARKGGVYFVTSDLWRKIGIHRVFNTLLDEQTILGIAIGASHLGALPLPEIQYLAYLHNAEDQLRGEAASLSFFSNGQYKNPMLCRVASFAYQKGFGGHFHNDNSMTVLRDIPGIVIATPSNGEDAVHLLRTCMASCKVNGAVCVFLEPIALYMTKDLYETGDKKWLFPYPSSEEVVPIGKARQWQQGKDITILTFANGVWMSLRVAKKLEQEKKITSTLLDLRWLKPLPKVDIWEASQQTGRVLIVDEGRKTGGISEEIITFLVESGFKGSIHRVTGQDTFIPLGDAANCVLVQEEHIEQKMIEIMEMQ